ncbi:hypothetical protein SKAU_G00051200 [Synaphobranchus kaupii]|uniref:Secreted protein n=1 Tax=Synaphobranchus kaupii TaxID=118154 RepID=A0A9Q1G4G0_SYNKA|nr:hypothetical protein SKAU_G00051200 [Synaphobranchus kaupii]
MEVLPPPLCALLLSVESLAMPWASGALEIRQRGPRFVDFGPPLALRFSPLGCSGFTQALLCHAGRLATRTFQRATGRRPVSCCFEPI